MQLDVGHQNAKGRMRNAKDEKSRSRIIWVSMTQNFASRMWKEESGRQRIAKRLWENVIVPRPVVWEIEGHKELEGDQWCKMVGVERQLQKL